VNPAIAPTPIRIAIVEDDTATRKMLVAAVKTEADYTIAAEFSEGKTAIASLPAMAPDLLLVDLGLPDISGIEIIRTVAKDVPQCGILVITTLGDEATIIKALEAGAGGYILKGTSPEELQRDIHALREGGSPLSPAVARSLLNRLQIKQSEVTEAVDTVAGIRRRDITQREINILQTIARGHSYKETSKICGITIGTVHSHLKNIYRKLLVHSKTQAIHEARERKLIQ
jgi:DNA-binding NarL/FixJ family response regulator